MVTTTSLLIQDRRHLTAKNTSTSTMASSPSIRHLPTSGILIMAICRTDLTTLVDCHSTPAMATKQIPDMTLGTAIRLIRLFTAPILHQVVFNQLIRVYRFQYHLMAIRLRQVCHVIRIAPGGVSKDSIWAMVGHISMASKVTNLQASRIVGFGTKLL